MAALDNPTIPFDYSPNKSENTSKITPDEEIALVDDRIRQLMADTKVAFNFIQDNVISNLSSSLDPSAFAPGGSIGQVLTRTQNGQAWQNIPGLGARNTQVGIQLVPRYGRHDPVKEHTFNDKRVREILDRDNPTAITSDGQTMWIADQTDNELYGVDLYTGTRRGSEDFNTLSPAGNTTIGDILAIPALGLMLVSDLTDDKIYAYDLSNKGRRAGDDLESTLLRASRLRYETNINSNNYERTIEWASGSQNVNPYGMWHDGIYLYVVDSNRFVYAYDLSSKRFEPNECFRTANENTSPRGIWGNDKYIWISNDTSNKTVFAYDKRTKDRAPSQDMNSPFLLSENITPKSIWSDDEYMWVLDDSRDRINAYALYNVYEPVARSRDNVSSVTIDGSHPRQLRVNFQTAMSDTNYGVFTNALVINRERTYCTLRYEPNQTSIFMRS